MKCLSCKVNESQHHPMYGYLHCPSCIEKQSTYTRPTKQIEFIPERIRTDRKQTKDDTIQPFRGGEVSKEYLDTYGTKNIKVSQEEVRTARPVWDGVIDYYKHPK